MRITEAEVLRMAGLARLRLNPDELERFCGELSAILEYMDILQGVDTTAVEPTFHTHFTANALREDQVRQSQGLSDALCNARRHHKGSIVVPKVIE